MPHLTPNYLTVDPVTGAVGADFAGHVKASGIDLNAAETATPPTDRRIAWNRETDGALIAEVFGWEDSSHQGGQITGGPPGWTFGGQFAQLRVTKDLVDGGIAKVEAQGVNQPGGRSGYVSIIDELQRSGFLQLPFNQLRATRTIFGQVNADGTTARDGSGGWSAVNSAAGTYVITPDFAVTRQAWLPVGAVPTNPPASMFAPMVTAQSGASFTLLFRNSAGTAVNTGFVFVAIGGAAVNE